MRTALLAAVKRINSGQLRAELTLGGRSVLGWQVDLIRALGCERIICLSEAPSGVILAMQREVEADGGTFHAVRTTIQLAGLVHADDELVMLRDGLIPERGLLQDMLGLSDQTGSEATERRLTKLIATLPASHPSITDSPQDFERIDRDRHWAGLAVMRASQLQKLADLPPDSDAMSLLLRLALQARVECVELDSSALEQGKWLLASDETALEEREGTLIADRRQNLSDAGLVGAVAAQIPVSLAPRWLANGSEVAAGVALAAGLAFLGAAGWGILGSGHVGGPIALSGLALAGIGAFAGEVSIAWGRLRQGLWSRAKTALSPKILRLTTDLVCLLALLFAHGIGPNAVVQLTLPILAIGLSRLAGEPQTGRFTGFWRDRSLHMLGFALAAAGGALSEAIALFTLGALAQLILRARGD